MHNFKLYEQSVGENILEYTLVDGSGYQGILKLHKNSCVPKKKKKSKGS